MTLQPGTWSHSFEIVSLDVPGHTNPAMKEIMEVQFAWAKTRPFNQCLTAEAVEKPPMAMIAGKQNGDCRFDTLTMADGKLSATMTCARAGQPGSATIRIAGTYTSTTFDSSSETEAVDPKVSAGTIRMMVQARAVRIGECKSSGKDAQ